MAQSTLQRTSKLISNHVEGTKPSQFLNRHRLNQVNSRAANKQKGKIHHRNKNEMTSYKFAIQSKIVIRQATTQYLLQYQMKGQSKYSIKELFVNLSPFLNATSPFSSTQLQSDWCDAVFQQLETYEILVVGAGGLGCEIVKNLALSGIRKIHLIDMDTIDLTNLNRQFLFRQKDINKKKAEVVADFVMRRCPGVEVIPHTCRVQEKEFSFYANFNVIIGGLDNIEARRYLNAIVHQLNQNSDNTVCFYIDGATEGFEGQCVVVQPFKTSCYNCTLLDGLADRPKANYCTIANTPRTPEHCIQYVLELEWDKHFPDEKRDNDNLQHMKWIYERAAERAKKFNIEGVTEMLTLGLAKNIIPAIASTNALIAAFCTNEALKVIMAVNPILNNYFFYRGGTSAGSNSLQFVKKPNCSACEMKNNKLKTLQIEIQQSQTFKDLLQKISKANPVISPSPFVNLNKTLFYNPVDGARSELKQKKTMKQLVELKIFDQKVQEIVVTDKCLKSQQIVIVKIVEDAEEKMENF